MVSLLSGCSLINTERGRNKIYSTFQSISGSGSLKRREDAKHSSFAEPDTTPFITNKLRQVVLEGNTVVEPDDAME
jgi:hypothetical protein